MITADGVDIYRRALSHFGSGHQIRKCVEELTELSLALQHHLKDPGDATEVDVIDELADVFITCHQMVIHFGEYRVNSRIAYKEKVLLDAMSTPYYGEPKSAPTDEQLEHTVTIEDTGEKESGLPYFDGIGYDYSKVLVIKTGKIVEVCGYDGCTDCVAELRNDVLVVYRKEDVYPFLPLWRILKAAEEDKTLVVTVWLSQFKKFEDFNGSYFSTENIYGLRRIEAVDNSCESKTHRLMKKLGLQQEAAETVIKHLGWARVDHILSLEDRPV